MDNKNKVLKDGIELYLSSKVYSKDSIIKCLYWYSDKFNTNIDFVNDSHFKIILKVINVNNEKHFNLNELLHKLERDLIDYNLRDIVTKETQNIRDLLTAKAFSNGEFDETPPGEISDPVGFKI